MSIRIITPSTSSPVSSPDGGSEFRRRLAAAGLDKYVFSRIASNGDIEYGLHENLVAEWFPDYDTTGLCDRLNLDTQHNAEDLEREILLAMLLSPVPFIFPGHAELASALRIRSNIVLAARKTSLDFHTSEAERPNDYWTYHEDSGFTILPGRSLIEALKKATQPEVSGQKYSFSCYRATEYVILLGIAEELQASNPPLYEKLRKQWEASAIMSGSFHEAFLKEYGTMQDPLPQKFYVPGDRVWFRNPDKASAEITGYEGSWVIYLGCGLFTNFWDEAHPYTLDAKCIEIYHWRHATRPDKNGEMCIDESIVARQVSETLQHPEEISRILSEMMRYRDPMDVHATGGCIDSTREYPRYVCPGTADLAF